MGAKNNKFQSSKKHKAFRIFWQLSYPTMHNSLLSIIVLENQIGLRLGLRSGKNTNRHHWGVYDFKATLLRNMLSYE